jgi:guanylate kinase
MSSSPRPAAESQFDDAPALRRPLLIVMSAPSGAGKTTLCGRWLAGSRHLVASVSCTTRQPRAGEVPGSSYHFLGDAEFSARVARGEFLEHAVVHNHQYGTLRQTVLEALMRNQDIILAIDVQGAATIRRQALAPDAHPLIRNGYTDVFVAPPSFAVLRARLTGRGTDAPEVIAARLRNAEDEMTHWREYRYLVVNDDLDAALARLQAIREAEHCRLALIAH